MKKSQLISLIREEINSVLKEYITSNNEMYILKNAAKDINDTFFNNRGHYDYLTNSLHVRESKDEVIKKLKQRTEVIEQEPGFSADKDDRARTYYQLPEYNVSIEIEQTHMSRSSEIKFLNFEGVKPKPEFV